ncbi:MAG: ABC transporter permease [Bacteroidales bacterium]|nr:ABC transporter permease [Bacteroidales bacterium]
MKSLLYQIRSHKLAYALNVLGLSIALAAFYLFATQVEFNRTYNHSIKDHERTYRVEVGGFTTNADWSCYMIRTFELTIKEMTHVEDVVSDNMVHWKFPVYVGGNQFDDIMSTQIGDPGLDFFGVKMLYGTSHYTTRTQAVVTKSVAEQLFGTADAVGKTFSIPQAKRLTVGTNPSPSEVVGRGVGPGELEVIGVAEDMPANCLLQDGIYLGLKNISFNSGQAWSFLTYVRLDSPDNKESVEASMRKMLMEKYGSSDWMQFNKDTRMDIRLNCLDETYFSGVNHYDKGNRNLVTIIFWSALFVLIVALLNYSNFILAQAPSRIRSINTRKVMGASALSLRMEFVAECVVLAVVALFLSTLWVKLFALNDDCMSLMSGNVDFSDHLELCALTFAGAVMVGVLSGIYPAWFATSFAPALALKGAFGLSPKGRQLRTLMVCMQMVVGFVLTLYIGVMMCQTRHIYSSDYGFNKDEILFTMLSTEGMSKKDVLNKELEQLPWVESVAYGMIEPGDADVFMQWGGNFEGGVRRYFYMMPANKDLLKTLGIEMVEGRDFNDSDKDGAFIITESSARRYKNFYIGQPLAPLELNSGYVPITYPVVGVCKDFQFTTMRVNSSEKDMAFIIYGTGMEYWSDDCKKIFIRTKAGYDKLKAKQDAAKLLDRLCHDKQHTFYFLDDCLEKAYEEEFRFIGQVKLFAFICIFITLIGVFCLTMFETECRRKEIAIRKVMSSSVGEVLSLFTRRYILPLILSFAIAAPIGYYLSEQWLQNFAEHTPIYWWIFPLAFVIVSVVVLLTVVVQSWHVATKNPMESIKTE